ncbi:MAG TPA: cytochrome bc complex cytochrome b subunit [Gammaproteobacteria bacterium]|nr:cytochrome bc complex cytochrome b subunit [Gammaproteobacteria bacterium]
MNKVTSNLVSLRDWVDARFPLMKLWNEHLAEYYAPKNFNFWYFFGSLALVVLLIQIVTGIWLTMNYKPSAEEAFASVEYIMRDVEWGWWIRYMHSTGASAFFIVIYLHMFRALLYGSFKKPRELLWITGMLIYLTLMGEAFFGYLLPWGQMSYWGAQVIISLFGAIPIVGDELALWIRGDYVVSDVTLNRFFAFHVIAMPLVLLALVVMHIMALHEVGSNNPDGVDIKKKKDDNGVPLDGIPFHPYYTVKDIVGVTVFLILFSIVVFYAPEMGGYFLEHANFIPADPLKTPEHIAPVWYFTPFYAILRAVPSQVGGVFAMGLATMMFFFLPWLDRSPVKSIRYRGWKYRTALAAFTISFLALGWLGLQVATPLYTWMSRFFAIVYFAFFLLMPFYTSTDNDKPVPERVT